VTARQHADALLRETSALISLPEICFRLREVLADPEHSRREVADIIIRDPALTSRLLRIVNSGLLLNVGKLLLYYCEPQLLSEVESQARESRRPDFEIERELLGFDHADVGALMAEKWNFSDRLRENISGHHEHDSTAPSPDQSIMRLTAIFSDQFDFTHPKQIAIETIAEEHNTLLESLQLTDQDLSYIVNNSYEGYLQSFEAFCGGAS